jgi:transcriptional regulator with XRE-family HTH domain
MAAASVDARETVRCFKLNCQLVQYRTSDNNCRRCHSSLELEPEPVTPAPLLVVVPVPHPGRGRGHSFLDLASTVRTLRLRLGLSQRQLSIRMRCPRSYVSKIENERATPTLGTLEKLALALRVTAVELVSPSEDSRREEVDELMRSQLVRALVPYVSLLTAVERACVLSRTQDLIEARRRNAWSTRLS